jgi:hypothetical protein
MNHTQRRFAHTAQALMAAAAVLVGVSALAATQSAAAESQAADKPARAGCPYGPSLAGRATCMTKADFDVTQSRQVALDADPAQYLRNALKRCEPLSGDDRQDCVARTNGKGTTTGSVEGGGIYRELITREVGVLPAPATQGEAGMSDTKK